MSKLTDSLEGLLLPLTCSMGIIISLADLFDFLRFMGDHTPMLAVLLVSIALGSLAFIQHRCLELQQNIRELILEAKLEHLDGIADHVDPNLRKVLDDDYFDDILNFFQKAIHESKVTVNDDTRFLHYYIRTLQFYPKSTFLITCTSATTHLWQDTVLEAMGNFIQGGGTVRLLFFFKDAQELNKPEVKMAVSHLQQRGVRVLATYYNTVLPELKKNFIIESKDRIAWEFHFDEGGNILTSTVTTNKKSVKAFHKIVEKVRSIELQMVTEQEPGVKS